MGLKIVKHKNKFAKIKRCPGCELQGHRKCQVVGRGKTPAEVLFIGEGPNKTEDLLGQLMVGPPGALLDEMIKDASVLINETTPTYYLTNGVLCRPWIWDVYNKDFNRNREASKQEILACMPNIIEIARIVKPSLVVFIGRSIEKFYRKEFPDNVHISHPEFHLSFGGKSSPTYLQDVRTLSEAFKELT
jgi:uracil-DNA glycosylase family 4